MKKNLLTLDIILSKEIKYMLQEQGYKPGDKLPSERELAERFQVQRLTIRSALNLLLQDRTILSKPRSGYYVAPRRILQSTTDFSMDYSQSNTGEALTCELLDFKKLHADMHLSGKMLLPEDTIIYKIVRLYSEQGIPICINNAYIPEYIYPNLTRSVAASAPPTELITNNCQVSIVKSNQKVTLIYANELEAQLLKIAPGSPLMKYKGLMYDNQGRLAIFFENIMLIDHFGFIREASV